MVPKTLVSYIETFSSGTLNLIKELSQDQVEAVRGADERQDLTSLSTRLTFLKKNVSNNIQGSFPNFWSAVDDIEEDLDKKAFGITFLNNFIDNLNITDLQRKIPKWKLPRKIEQADATEI